MGFDVKLVQKIEKKFSETKVPGLSMNVFSHDNNGFSLSLGRLDRDSEALVTGQSVFHACSMSKMVTAIGVLRLVQQGVLDLGVDVNRYLKDWKIKDSKLTEQKKVTLRNLLAHQGGFEDSEGSFNIYNPEDILPTIDDILAGDNKYSGESMEIKYTPESKFSYSDAGYCVIEKIIETVTDKSFSVAMEDLVIKPLGLQRTFFLNYNVLQKLSIEYEIAVGHDKCGNVVENRRAFYPYLASAGLWTTPSELSIITQQIIDSWNDDTNILLDSKLAGLMLTDLGEGCNPHVGLGVFISPEESKKRFKSQGWGVGFQSMLVAYPVKKSGVIVMINSDPGKSQEESLVGEIIEMVNEELQLREGK